ncbi:Hypothetical_protein [Hexamita inflata]|uniref:Hypothetical_protein n=1 Tax=Hexamita inflata TaxID=28002 RepID=A0AA86U9P7_9EUKA|nr:Hypothetical protein HINF_LOCUS30482 [Hexamita inflata]
MKMATESLNLGTNCKKQCGAGLFVWLRLGNVIQSVFWYDPKNIGYYYGFMVQQFVFLFIVLDFAESASEQVPERSVRERQPSENQTRARAGEIRRRRRRGKFSPLKQLLSERNLIMVSRNQNSRRHLFRYILPTNSTNRHMPQRFLLDKTHGMLQGAKKYKQTFEQTDQKQNTRVIIKSRRCIRQIKSIIIQFQQTIKITVDDINTLYSWQQLIMEQYLRRLHEVIIQQYQYQVSTNILHVRIYLNLFLSPQTANY